MLGILTLYLNEQKQLEERPIYQRMIIEGKKLGLNVFVFTPQDVNEQSRRIMGMFYQPEKKQWIRKLTPFPHMIFDRCRLQSSYRFEQLKRFRSKHRHLSFLNRPLRNKWLIFQALNEVPDFRAHLPKTKLYSTIADVQRMIKEDPLLYLKPINGTGGRGILRIEKLKGTRTSIYVQGRDRSRRIIAPQRMTWTQLMLRLSAWSAKDRYLVQQGISLTLPNGRVHDYRMLVQKSGDGIWEVTGCAGRIGANKSITSNLHGGGEAVKMDTLLSKWMGSDQRMQQVKEEAGVLGIKVAAFLEEKYGALCELALDLAIDRGGTIWLLEVNPKPSREVFARIGDRETYQKAIARPMEYGMWHYRTNIVKDKLKTEEPQNTIKAVAELQGTEVSEISNMNKTNSVKKSKHSRHSKPYYPFTKGKHASSLGRTTSASNRAKSQELHSIFNVIEDDEDLYLDDERRDETSSLIDLIRSYDIPPHER